MSETPETDAARMKGYGEFGGDWVALERHHYEKHPEGDVVFYEVAEKLERERDEARRELAEAQEGWNKALDERNQARKDLIGERNFNQGAFEWLEAKHDAACARLADSESNRERMKKRYAHARKLQRVKTSVMAGVIEQYYNLLKSTLDTLDSSLEILEPTVKRNMPILAMYIDSLRSKSNEISLVVGKETQQHK